VKKFIPSAALYAACLALIFTDHEGAAMAFFLAALTTSLPALYDL